MSNPALPGWRGVRVFVTGHTGFKGAWLCEWLLAEGAEVTGFALAPEPGSLFGDLGLAGRLKSVTGDIREFETTRRALADAAPEIVFHLAAQALVRAAYADPIDTFSTNVMGTANVLEAARRTPSVRAVVCVTSDKCYENREQAAGYREGDALGGRDPYSASKAAAEMIAGAYRQSILPVEGRVRLATARAGNVIGGGDWAADRLVPDLVRAFAEGRRPVLRNPGALRPWQHVLEPLRGYLALGAGLLAGAPVEGAWNFGPRPKDEIAVAELVRRFAAAWGAESGFDIAASPLAESQTLRLDIAKAETGLGWRPVLGLDDAIDMTAAWYRLQAGSPAGAADALRRQIERYRALAAAPASTN